MRVFIADILKFLFKYKYFRNKYFGIYKRIISPFHIFKNIKKIYVFEEKIVFELHLNDWIQQNIYLLGTYEEGELNFMKNFLKKGDTFIDIGANIGLHTLVASKITGKYGKVISFEPFQKNFELLKKNISLNLETENITVEKKAVYSKNTNIKLFYNTKDANNGMASSYTDGYDQKETVEAIMIDSYVKLHNLNTISMIKIDIEGGEFPALTGMKETLTTLRPLLLIEIDDEILKNTPYCANDIYDFLRDLGYKKYFLEESGNLTASQSSYFTYNYVFMYNQ